MQELLLLVRVCCVRLEWVKDEMYHIWSGDGGSNLRENWRVCVCVCVCTHTRTRE